MYAIFLGAALAANCADPKLTSREKYDCLLREGPQPVETTPEQKRDMELCDDLIDLARTRGLVLKQATLQRGSVTVTCSQN